MPVFNTAYDILSKIPDIESASKRGHRINATFFNSCYYEFFFDKDKGLFEVIYLEHGGEHHQIYGKTNKEIIQHILDELIIDDAHSFYANRKIEETCAKKPVDMNDYDTWRILFFKYSNESLEYGATFQFAKKPPVIRSVFLNERPILFFRHSHQLS